jgi:hypothetical protein
MLLLTAIAAITAIPSGGGDRGSATSLATATVRIEHAIRIDRELWTQASESKRREKVVTDEKGERVLLRLVEME